MIRANKPEKLWNLLQDIKPVQSLNTQELLGLTVALIAMETTVNKLETFMIEMGESRR